ncbi:integral membrane protein [Stemphylium lycopersici]|uniref:Integral membrane protein n=1 Tax=Stemphylium lycopersici TaxID=183478 RepID=A0A364N718_STELY|nr:integral membrane protein [Stemphylium lycopersici]RAR13114.1 integral membrane protein [Stemphylium lycopersici]
MSPPGLLYTASSDACFTPNRLILARRVSSPSLSCALLPTNLTPAAFTNLQVPSPSALRPPPSALVPRLPRTGRRRNSRRIPSDTTNPPPRDRLACEHEERDVMKDVTTPRDGASWQTDTSQLDIPSIQPTQTPPPSRRKQTLLPALTSLSPFVLLLLFASFLPLASAVFVNFKDCLTRIYLADGRQTPYLRFEPEYVWADFSPEYRLNVTVYGNVSGQAEVGDYPPLDDDNWKDPNKTFGKIVDLNENHRHYTTLFWNNRVLSYTGYNAPPSRFCSSVLNTSCPVAPAFEANASEYWTLPAVSVAHDFGSSYAFSTWASMLRIVSGNNDATTLGCISANITPDLGKKLADTLCYFPAAILGLVGLATVFAATCSPWGTSNVFRSTSNYGRDEDLIRLVTPGFGDCLQYIQFIVLAGSLSLNFPGFFQPAISQASWSVLLFNQSFVSGGDGAQSLVDGIYFVNGTYGLTRLGQYVGMTKERDMWASMAIFLLVLIACIVVLTQVGFFVRWLVRWLTNTQDGDLTGKNWAFTAGNIIRIVFNYFLLPIIALSLFQLVVAPRSPTSVVVTAVIMLLLVAGVATWIFWFIFTTRPRAHLFDDLPTVLTYGPLYNTYSDDAAPFAFIPVLLTIIRGIAIGAIQPSGIAQIIVLAICEVILILTLHAFRPFQSNTSMNAYHTFFATVRLACVLLSVAFVPSLDVDESPKGWIGYIILLLHAIVLIFGFFLNALQTIIEVAARLTGAGADQRGGLSAVFGKRQLSKRNVHRHARSSLNSNAAMLAHDENKNIHMGSRSRSLSASSAVLLNGPYDRDSQRASVGFDGFSQGDYGNTSPIPGQNAVPFTFLGSGSSQNSRRPTMGVMDAADPYYRPPRPRKHTMDSMTPSASGKAPLGSADIVDAPYSDHLDNEAIKAGEGPSRNSSTPAPAYLRLNRDDSDSNLDRRTNNNTDYSVRESDFYYGLRGPALSSQPTRKLKTGPADPMSPVSSAAGWFKSLNLLGGRKKEKSKGFEVVRSSRMPPQMMAVEEDAESPEVAQEPYRDSPDSPPQARKISGGSGVASAAALGGERRNSSSSDSESESSEDEEHYQPVHRISPIAPTLGPIDSFGGIELPSRIGSRASRVTQAGPPSRTPTIPRRNSRRTPSTEAANFADRLSTVMDVPSSGSPRFQSPRQSHHLQPGGSGGLPIRLPFGSSEPSPERSPGHSTASSTYRNDGVSEFTALPTIGVAGERPLSTGFVQHHMTKDSVQTDGYAAGSHLEASAEIVDRSRSGSTQHSGRSHHT